MGKTGIVLRDPAGVIGNVSPDGPPWATAPEWTNVRRHIASGRPDPLAATIAGGASTADYPSRHIAYSPRHRIGRNRQTSLPSPTAPVPGGDAVGGRCNSGIEQRGVRVGQACVHGGAAAGARGLPRGTGFALGRGLAHSPSTRLRPGVTRARPARPSGRPCEGHAGARWVLRPCSSALHGCHVP